MKKSLNIFAALAFLSFIMFILLSVSGAEAVSWVNSCINETHMLQEYEINEDGVIVTGNQTIPCLYNCSSDYQKCNDPPKTRPDDSALIAIVVGFGMMALSMFYISVKTTKKGYEGLQMMFMIYGILMLMGLANILLSISNEASSKSAITATIETSYNLLAWGIIFVIFYIIIYAILYYFGYVGKEASNLKGGRLM